MVERMGPTTQSDEGKRYDSITPPLEDASGRVIEPAIDFDTGLMPNGQSVRSFYERDGQSLEKAEWQARFAVANATRRLLDL